MPWMRASPRVLAATVTEQSRVGLGGEIPILIKMKDKPVIVISGVGVAGSKATVQFFENRTDEPWEQPGHIAPDPRHRTARRDHAGLGRRAAAGA